VIIDHHPTFRERLDTFVREQDGCSVAGITGDTFTGLRLVRDTRPDVVLIDVGLTDEGGLELARRVAGLDLGVRIVMMGENETAEYERAATLAGAIAYVSKTQISHALPALLHVTANGRVMHSSPSSTTRECVTVHSTTGGAGATVALSLPPVPRYAGWEAAFSAAMLASGIALDQPASAVAGVLGFIFLSYRQLTLPRLFGGHSGGRVLHRTQRVR
jgi:DNA-binding NarL/FixJ family response regulator